MSTGGLESDFGASRGPLKLFLEEARSAAAQLQSTLGAAGPADGSADGVRLAQGSWRTVASLAHQLRGAASFVGLFQVAKLAGNLEEEINACSEEQLGGASPRALLPVVDRLLDVLLADPSLDLAASECDELQRTVASAFDGTAAEPDSPVSGTIGTTELSPVTRRRLEPNHAVANKDTQNQGENILPRGRDDRGVLDEI